MLLVWMRVVGSVLGHLPMLQTPVLKSRDWAHPAANSAFLTIWVWRARGEWLHLVRNFLLPKPLKPQKILLALQAGWSRKNLRYNLAVPYSRTKTHTPCEPNALTLPYPSLLHACWWKKHSCTHMQVPLEYSARWKRSAFHMKSFCQYFE